MDKDNLLCGLPWYLRQAIAIAFAPLCFLLAIPLGVLEGRPDLHLGPALGGIFAGYIFFRVPGYIAEKTKLGIAILGGVSALCLFGGAALMALSGKALRLLTLIAWAVLLVTYILGSAIAIVEIRQAGEK